MATSPMGGECRVYRSGVQVAHVGSAPETVRVSRRNSDMLVGCVKDGYDFEAQPIKSGTNGWIFGNLFTWGVLGFIIDFADGSFNHYHAHNTIVLRPLDKSVGQPSLPDFFPGPVPRKPVQPATSSIVAAAPVGADTDGPQRR